jgi:hypothetical protein
VRLVCPEARRVFVCPNVIVPSAKSGASSGRALREFRVGCEVGFKA